MSDESPKTFETFYMLFEHEEGDLVELDAGEIDVVQAVIQKTILDCKKHKRTIDFDDLSERVSDALASVGVADTTPVFVHASSLTPLILEADLVPVACDEDE